MKAERLTVISESGEKLGEFSKSEAIIIAEDKGLDILQITFDKEPCVAKIIDYGKYKFDQKKNCLLYTSPSPRDAHESRMPSSA